MNKSDLYGRPLRLLLYPLCVDTMYRVCCHRYGSMSLKVCSICQPTVDSGIPNTSLMYWYVLLQRRSTASARIISSVYLLYGPLLRIEFTLSQCRFTIGHTHPIRLHVSSCRTSLTPVCSTVLILLMERIFYISRNYDH